MKIKMVMLIIIDWFWWNAIRFMPTKYEEYTDYVLVYKELWGYRKLLEVRPRYR